MVNWIESNGRLVPNHSKIIGIYREVRLLLDFIDATDLEIEERISEILAKTSQEVVIETESNKWWAYEFFQFLRDRKEYQHFRSDPLNYVKEYYNN